LEKKKSKMPKMKQTVHGENGEPWCSAHYKHTKILGWFNDSKQENNMENQIQAPLTIEEDQIQSNDEWIKEYERGEDKNPYLIGQIKEVINETKNREEEYRKQYIGELGVVNKKLLSVNAFFSDPNEFDNPDTLTLPQNLFTNRDCNKSIFDYKIPDEFSPKKKTKQKKIKRRRERRRRRRRKKKSKKLLIVVVSVLLLAFVWYMIKDIRI
jgi:hypothetical protein